MSRIGRMPITVPDGVKVDIGGGEIKVKGAKGELGWRYPERVKVTMADKKVIVERIGDEKTSRALHGLSRSLINNMVTGVSAGYTREMELVGVGYRATIKGEQIDFALGYSHPVIFKLPKGITAEVDKKQTKLVISGFDKQLLGQTAANIRSLRPPDAYKGKGVRYAGERIKLKPGKSGTK